MKSISAGALPHVLLTVLATFLLPAVTNAQQRGIYTPGIEGAASESRSGQLTISHRAT